MKTENNLRRTALHIERLERRDLLAGDMVELALVSIGTPGDGAAEPGNESSLRPAISANGRYVAFNSSADNLVPGDTNDATDVFVKDLWTGVLERVSTDKDGNQGDRSASSSLPSLSGDGRYVAFSSRATNLVAHDPNGGLADIFVTDRETGKVTLASQSANGIPSAGGAYVPALSHDARFVAYIAGDGVYLKDLQTQELTPVDKGYFEEVSITADGRSVAYDDGYSVFVKDMETGETTVASTDSLGNHGNSWSFFSTISANGRYVAFGSYSDNLVADDANGHFADIFLKDLETGTTTLVSNAANGDAGDDAAFRPALSADGRYVAFQSYASNLVDEDSNGIGSDIFLKDLQTNEVTLVSTTEVPTSYNRARSRPAISGDGRYVAFDSRADQHIAGESNGEYDVFRADLHNGPGQTPGNVTAEIRTDSKRGTVLVLTGDAGDNQIRVSSSAAGRVLVEGISGTTISQHSVDMLFVGINAVELDLGSGADMFSALDLQVHGLLNIDTGSGDDIVVIKHGSMGGLRVDTEYGMDRVTVDSSAILGDTDIELGKGDDVLTVVDSLFSCDALFSGGLDNDLVTLLGVNIFTRTEKFKRFEMVR